MAKGRNKENKDELVAAKDIEGKKVMDDKGKTIGTVLSIRIDPITFNVKGITIDNGSFKGSNFIDSSYIGSLSEEGIVLLSEPINQQYLDELYE